jgi:hypothetical protein
MPGRNSARAFVCVLFAAAVVLSPWRVHGDPVAVSGAGDDHRIADTRKPPRENNDIRVEGKKVSRTVALKVRTLGCRISGVNLGPLKLSTRGLIRKNSVFLNLIYSF